MTAAAIDPLDELQAIHARLRAAWEREGGLPVAERKTALMALRRALLRNADAFVATIAEDFGVRSRHETLLTEVVTLIKAIDHALPRLRRWSAPSAVHLGLPFWPARGRIIRQPRGVVGVIAPSNYPLQLALMPLVGALSAGCRVLVKPSEATPRTASLIKAVIEEALDGDIAGVALGGPDVSAAVTRLPLGMLLFTGSERVGRSVMAAAAERLTPVILELGGKSPVVVDDTADLAAAATSIIAGKLLNAGQTCVAPDYVLVSPARREALVAALRSAATRLYPDARDYSGLLSQRAGERMRALATGHATLPLLTEPVAAPRFGPALVLSPPLNSPIMREEIFGPLLAVLTYDTLDDVVRIIRDRPEPLTLYWFGSDRRGLAHVMERTRSGAVSVNETVMHAGVEALPFGGIGGSGMGRYHGKAGFDAFTHERPMFLQARWTLTKLLRPPFRDRADMILKRLLR